MKSWQVGDHEIALSERGHEQAREVGRSLGRAFLDGAMIYSSPYRRTRETLAGILDGVGLTRPDLRVYEDPRLREVEHGYEDVPAQEARRKTHGWFYYRFTGGESPADCYDRTSSFLESMMRQAERKQADRVLVVTHGLTIRCFVMRFLHLSVEQFDEIANPRNCAVITLADKDSLRAPYAVTGRWAVEGLERRREPAQE
ncbi:MAG: histidine phosphatase family protein [Deltaproteobacteria bacterium]|nr:histidine phosphatase family protein [Deltaproteobacteria bacterium]